MPKKIDFNELSQRLKQELQATKVEFTRDIARRLDFWELHITWRTPVNIYCFSKTFDFGMFETVHNVDFIVDNTVREAREKIKDLLFKNEVKVTSHNIWSNHQRTHDWPVYSDSSDVSDTYPWTTTCPPNPATTFYKPTIQTSLKRKRFVDNLRDEVDNSLKGVLCE